MQVRRREHAHGWHRRSHPPISTSAGARSSPAPVRVPMSSVSTLGRRDARLAAAAGGSNHAPVHDCDARHHVGINHRPGETCATHVKHAHDVTVADIRWLRQAVRRTGSRSPILWARETGPGSIWLWRRLAG
jgi:hypothetical protein